jgi:hypothetical protein
MKNYYFYSKLDPKQEAIASTSANSKEDAITFFSKLKHLTQEKFLSIFSVGE